jgi:endonuclease-3
MPKMNTSDLKNRADAIVRTLAGIYPNGKIELNFSSPWELFVAVVLSAQCTDARVNLVTGKLFKKYKSFDNYLHVDIKEFSNDISSINFYNNKAKNILASAKIIKEKFDGRVPDTMTDLLILPGIARKSANVILGTIYGKVEGVIVDTHIKRLSQKFELVDSTDPIKIERELMEVLDKKDWYDFGVGMVLYGRHVCKAAS